MIIKIVLRKGVYVAKRKNNVLKRVYAGGARFCKSTFVYTSVVRGVGVILYSNIYNVFFCDIRLLIVISNRQVSHF